MIPASDQHSRPGPVFGSREGVFQTGSSGEYPHMQAPSYSDSSSISSPQPGPSPQQIRWNLVSPDDSHRESTAAAAQDDPLHSDDRDARRTIVRTMQTDKINIYYQNVGGMNTRVNDYYLASSDDTHDIIALGESWLTDRTVSTQVFGHTYEVFRCDRSTKNSKKARGGGVVVAVRGDLKPKP